MAGRMSRCLSNEAAPMPASDLKRAHRGDAAEPPSKRARADSANSDSSFGSLSSDADEISAGVLSTPHTPLTPASPSALLPSRRKTRFCPYPDCGKAFNRPARLEEHIRSHTNERPFRCPHSPCEKDFLRQSHLTHHIKSAHTSIRDYACEWEGCDKCFLTATRLRRHQQAHEGREQFRCTGFPPCAETFRKHATLQNHIDKDHFHRKPHPCDQVDDATGQKCEHGYDTIAKLKAHKKKHHGENGNAGRYWCSLCSSPVTDESTIETHGFTTYSELQNHISTAHPQQCDECALTCSSAAELQRHVEIHHSGTTLDERRLFPCTVGECGRAFTKRGNLNVHIRAVHADLRPFVCGVTDLTGSRGIEAWTGEGACRQGFGAKSTLEAHVRSQHLGLPYPARKRPVGSIKTEKPSPSDVSTVAKLTGAGYAEESGRDIACFEATCPHRFLRDYDLRVHAVAKHGMGDADVIEAFREREALAGGDFWIGAFDGIDMRDYAAADHGAYGWPGVGGMGAEVEEGTAAAVSPNWDFDFSLSLTAAALAIGDAAAAAAAVAVDGHGEQGDVDAVMGHPTEINEVNDGYDMDELIDPALAGLAG